MSSAQTSLLLKAAEPLPEPGCSPAHGPEPETQKSQIHLKKRQPHLLPLPLLIPAEAWNAPQPHR